MPVFLFFSPIQFVRSFSFVIGENDNYLPLVLFPFLVSSQQSFHWIEYQRLFLWKKKKIILLDTDKMVGERLELTFISPGSVISNCHDLPVNV